MPRAKPAAILPHSKCMTGSPEINSHQAGRQKLRKVDRASAMSSHATHDEVLIQSAHDEDDVIQLNYSTCCCRTGVQLMQAGNPAVGR